MAELGSLVARLGLDTRDLDRGAESADKKLRGVSRRMRDLVNKAGTAVVSLGAVGTALAVNVVNQAGAAARELRNLAQVSNTSIDEFQRQAHAARQFGIEQEKLADIFKDMNDRVGDFLTTGAGPMADFFEQIGPKVGATADDFRGLSGPDALQRYVRYLEEANVSQQEMTFYLEAMASDATALLPLLRNNGSELARLSAEADEFGLVVSRIENDALIETKDALDELTSAMGIASTRATAALAPAFQAIAEGLRDELGSSMKDSQGDFLEWADTVGDVLAFSADAVVGAARVITASFNTIGLHLGARAAQAGAIITGEWDMIGRINQEFAADVDQTWGNVVDGSLTTFRDRLAAIREDMERMAGLEEIEITAGRRSSNLVDTEAAEAEEEAAAKAEAVQVEQMNRRLEREREGRMAQLNMLREFVANENELEIKRHEERLAVLDEAMANEDLTWAEHQQLREDLEAEHMDRLEEIRRAGLTDLERLTETSFANQARTAAQYLSDITAGASRESKTLFEINKVAAIAEALLNAKSAILGAYKVGAGIGGPPLGSAFAAAAAAATGAQVAAIKSASFGGGGGVAPSVIGTTPAPPVSPVGPGGGQQSPGQVISIEGLSADQLFSGGQVRALLEKIQDAQDDGAKVVFSK